MTYSGGASGEKVSGGKFVQLYCRAMQEMDSAEFDKTVEYFKKIAKPPSKPRRKLHTSSNSGQSTRIEDLKASVVKAHTRCTSVSQQCASISHKQTSTQLAAYSLLTSPLTATYCLAGFGRTILMSHRWRKRWDLSPRAGADWMRVTGPQSSPAPLQRSLLLHRNSRLLPQNGSVFHRNGSVAHLVGPLVLQVS